MKQFIITKVEKYLVEAESESEANETNGKLIHEARLISETGKPQPTLPLERWPTWAKRLREVATPLDKGIGDVVVRVIGAPGTPEFSQWIEDTFKRRCKGCQDTPAKLNRIYALP